jgi:molybdopterin molybdotransferase
LHAPRKETLISLEEAQSLVLEAAAPLDTEVLHLKDAGGRVLAKTVRSSRDEPALTQAAMDGYAVRSADLKPDLQTILLVIGEVSAGQKGRLELKQGEAVRVMTGATVPKGADAVVPQETTETVDRGIRLKRPISAGDYLIPVGAEFRRGQDLLSVGTVLRVRELTMLAALGCEMVSVRRQPEVEVIATGSELIKVGERLRPGHVFASNLHTVSHLVKRCGGKVASLNTVGDDLDLLKRVIQQGTDANIIVTTGGTGRGKKDLVSAAVASIGGDFCFRGVAMTPGKQTLFAKLGNTLLFGLPGRPPATYVAFEQLVRPALLSILGIPKVFLPEMTATLRRPIKHFGKILSFIFCRLIFVSEELQAESLETTGMLTEMSASNGLLKVTPHKEHLETGEQVRVQLLDIGLEGLSYFEKL